MAKINIAKVICTKCGQIIEVSKEYKDKLERFHVTFVCNDCLFGKNGNWIRESLVDIDKIDKLLKALDSKCPLCNGSLFTNSKRWIPNSFEVREYVECSKCNSEFLRMTEFSEGYKAIIKAIII